MTTNRLLRNILPSSTLWQSFKPDVEFYNLPKTLHTLGDFFQTSTDDPMSTDKPELPEAIVKIIDDVPAMEALGGMLFYLKSLNLDKDLISQKNFNIFDPISQGLNLVLDGQTLAHMEVGLFPDILDLLSCSASIVGSERVIQRSIVCCMV